jgi:hypothetical protein
MKKFIAFQIRWNEPLGPTECPYLHRWVVTAFNYSIRLHHWVRSDDRRHFHDHAWNFVSVILKGRYTNVTPKGRTEHKAPSMWYSDATERHYIEVPEGGTWTLLFCGRPFKKWGFFVGKSFWRPLRYFSKFGHPPCGLQ